MTAGPHLGHVHLRVHDLERSVAFYREILGLTVSDRYANYVFLSFGDHHHDLALQAVGGAADSEDDTAAGTASGPGVGLYHSAWEVSTAAALQETYRRLRERGVAVSPVDHGISKALYFDDPAGNGVEVYLDTREERGRTDWEGYSEGFDPAAL